MSVGNRERARREETLRRLAARQHGLIHRDQALSTGLSPSAVDRRLRSGAWVRHYRSVYGIAGAPGSFEQRALAACLASGPHAATSHTTAASLWGFRAADGRLHVTVAGAVVAEPPGVVVHRTTVRRAGDVGKLRGVPITNPVVTLVDLAAVLPEDGVESALHAAVTSGSVDARRIREHLRRRGGRGRRGVGVMKKMLADAGRGSHASSPLERALAIVLRAGDGLPPHTREYPVHAGGALYYLDFAYPPHRVGVEADGRRWHSDIAAFERDRARQNALAAAGWTILRVTDKHVRSCPELVRSQLMQLVGANVGNRR